MLEVLHSLRPPSLTKAVHGRESTRISPRTRAWPICTTVCRARVYIAATHLEGMERVEALLKAVGPGVQNVIALHTMTIIEEAVEGDTSLKVCDRPSTACVVLCPFSIRLIIRSQQQSRHQ